MALISLQFLIVFTLNTLIDVNFDVMVILGHGCHVIFYGSLTVKYFPFDGITAGVKWFDAYLEPME